jgi:hypothetical protein
MFEYQLPSLYLEEPGFSRVLQVISPQRAPVTYRFCVYASNPVPVDERILVKFGVYSTTSAEVSFGTSLEYLC